MGTPYIESFVVCGRLYGIEDYEDGQPMEDHFFGYKYKSGEAGDNGKRYKCWSGGSWGKPAETLEEAREFLAEHIVGRLEEERDGILKRLAKVEDALEQLKEPAHLFRFEGDNR